MPVTGPLTAEREEEMIETREPVVTEAVAVIDKALARMMKRELVSASEVSDLLLDLRSLLSAVAPTTDA
ncbi:MAG: hypothetical protein FJW53_03480 [Actinobacteria bacterium]|nr:hypothetical protein [Actinomycetota bacterium]